MKGIISYLVGIHNKFICIEIGQQGTDQILAPGGPDSKEKFLLLNQVSSEEPVKFCEQLLAEQKSQVPVNTRKFKSCLKVKTEDIISGFLN